MDLHCTVTDNVSIEGMLFSIRNRFSSESLGISDVTLQAYSPLVVISTSVTLCSKDMVDAARSCSSNSMGKAVSDIAGLVNNKIIPTATFTSSRVTVQVSTGEEWYGTGRVRSRVRATGGGGTVEKN